MINYWKTIIVPDKYIQGIQSGPINGSRSPTGIKDKSVDNSRSNSLPVKLRFEMCRKPWCYKIYIRDVSRYDSVKIRCHPGATPDNTIDYVRPTPRKKPEMIIFHTGTNNIQNKVNTFQKVRNVITSTKENDVNNEVKIAFSCVIHLDDQDFEEEIKEINRKLENLCKGKEIRFINNRNIDVSFLNRSKLHFNKSGTAQLVKNVSQALKPN